MTLRTTLPIILIIMADAAPALAAPWPICERGQPEAACVVDGDTVHWQGTKIRLARTDAPETEHARCPAEREAGLRARDRLAELLGAGAEVRLTGRTDRYRRALATIRTPAGDAEGILLTEGLTLPYSSSPAAQQARVSHWCGSR